MRAPATAGSRAAGWSIVRFANWASIPRVVHGRRSLAGCARWRGRSAREAMLVRTGYGAEEEARPSDGLAADAVVNNLIEAASWILDDRSLSLNRSIVNAHRAIRPSVAWRSRAKSAAARARSTTSAAVACWSSAISSPTNSSTARSARVARSAGAHPQVRRHRDGRRRRRQRGQQRRRARRAGAACRDCRHAMQKASSAGRACHAASIAGRSCAPSGYRTPVKTRILAGGVHSAKQQVVRIDREPAGRWTKRVSRAFARKLSRRARATATPCCCPTTGPDW